MEVDDVAVSYWQIWANGVSTRGIIMANGLVPRGPDMGCHVAPCNWFDCLKVYGVHRTRPRDLYMLPTCLAMATLLAYHTLFLVMYVV